MKFIDLAAQQKLIDEALRERMDAVLAHGQYIMGPEVVELESCLADYVEMPECVTVSSGTEALLISLMSLGVGPGDEVIVPAFTFVATAEVVALLGARPVFADVNPLTGNIDVNGAARLISNRTRAIIPVSLYGQPADIHLLNDLVAGSDNVKIIEDAAQSFGATLNGRRSCGLSDIGCTSFFPSKPLGCYGDGGAIFFRDEDLAQAAREIRVHGQSARYVHTRVGVGGRMDTLQCAILLAKWPQFSCEVDARQAIGARYTSELEIAGAKPLAAGELEAGFSGVRTLTSLDDRSSVYAQYTIVAADRNGLQQFLRDLDIPTAIHYPVALNEQPAYAAFDEGSSTPSSSSLSNHVLSLPMSPYLEVGDQDRVVSAVSDWISQSN